MEPDGLYRYTPSLSGTTLVRCIPFDSALSKHIGDALTLLSQEREWVEVGDDIQDIIDAASLTVESFYNQMLVGSVFPWLSLPPDGWLPMDGTTYALADYPELAAVLPDHLVSSPNFTLPDVTDAFPYGVQSVDDGSQVDGSNDLTLAVAQLPAHSHTYIPPTLSVDVETPAVPIPGVAVGAAIATGSTGSGDTIDKRPLRFGLVYAVFAGRV